jgi:MFS family permease
MFHKGLIGRLLSVGYLFGAATAAPFSDRIGRRRSMLLRARLFFSEILSKLPLLKVSYAL